MENENNNEVTVRLRAQLAQRSAELSYSQRSAVHI